MRIKKKNLEIKLSKLKKLKKLDIKLEQYHTPSEIVSEIILWADSFGDIYKKSICDLGSGSGLFAIAAKFLGAKRVLGVDIDPKSIGVAKENSKIANVDIKWQNKNILDLYDKFDTIIQNPPFGTKIKHSDKLFLEKALDLGKVTYSIHKSTEKVRQFINKYVKELGGKITETISCDFNIPNTYEFHKKRSYYVKIDIYRILRGD